MAGTIVADSVVLISFFSTFFCSVLIFSFSKAMSLMRNRQQNMTIANFFWLCLFYCFNLLFPFVLTVAKAQLKYQVELAVKIMRI